MRYLLVFLLLGGCSDPFADAQKVDTVENWETFLKSDPSTSQKMFAEDRIEELLTKKAEESKSIADYTAVLKRFPNSKNKKDLLQKRLDISMKEAEAANTEEAWKKVSEDNPEADPAVLKEARARADMAAYAAKISITEPVVKQINLGGDKKGELNGWSISATVKNDGDKVVAFLNLDCAFLKADGSTIRGDKYPVVGSVGPGGISMPDEFYIPMKPGDTRTWDYWTGDVPTDWNQTVKLTPASIRFLKEAPQ